MSNKAFTGTKEKVNTKYFIIFNIYFYTGVEGFEPPNGGTKTRSLTTWRYPK